MVADVNERGTLRDFFAKLSRKKNELVDVTEPFRDEATGQPKVAEKRRGTNQLNGDTGSGETLQKHRSKSVHALLLVRRVVTDQENHCFDPGGPRDGGDDRRKVSAVPRRVWSLGHSFLVRHSEVFFLPLHLALPRPDRLRKP